MNHTGTNYWKPKTVGSDFEMSPILSPLSPFRDQMVVVSGLSHPHAEALGDGNGDHARATATWLNGVHPKLTQGADVSAGKTVDQVAAQQFGAETALPSLELSIDVNYLVGNCEDGYACAYLNTPSWRTPTTPLPTENNPRVVFERLFGEGGSPAQRRDQMRNDCSILDAVSDDMAQLQRRLGPGDRARATEYFDSVREVERRIQKAEAAALDPDNSANRLGTTVRDQPPAAIPEVFGDHVKLMFDLQWLAYQSDITRVFTFMFGREVGTRIYPEIDITESHHPLSHHGDRPEQMKKYAKLNTYQAELFAYFLGKLRATPDGDGTLLDHTLLLYGAGLSDPNTHSHVDLPLTLVGGQLKGGRHLAVPLHTPMTNLLVSMLDKAGVRIDHLGDSTGRLKLETLTGI